MIQTLYKRSKLGKIQSWAVQVDKDKFCTHEGFVDGMITQSEWTICTGKYIGNSNETTPEQQALKEAEAKITKKKEQGYTENIEDVDNAKIKISPTLAFNLKDCREHVHNKRLVLSRKLDGVRCIVTKDGAFSRNGKLFYTTNHIQSELIKFFEQYPNVKTDGELFCTTENFNDIISLVRKTKPTQQDIEKAKIIEYHIYDVDTDGSYLERIKLIEDFLNQNFCIHLKLISNIIIEAEDVTDDLLDEYHSKFVEENFEGLMIRIASSKYSNCRTKDLLKKKDFFDAEFEIVDIEPGLGNRSAGAGRLICKLEDGRLFASGIKGNFEWYAELLKNKVNYVGKKATIQFQNRTPKTVNEKTGEVSGGSLRFPVCVSIRDYE